MRLFALSLLCMLCALSSPAQDIHVTWKGTDTSLDQYPHELSRTSSFETEIVGVNDYLYTYTQTLQASAQPNTGVQSLIDVILAGPGKANFSDACDETDVTSVGKVIEALADPALTPETVNKKIRSVALAESRSAYEMKMVPALQGLKNLFAHRSDPTCGTALEKYRPIEARLQKMAAADAGDHTIRGRATLTPGFDYKLIVTELYGGVPTEVGSKEFTFSPTNNAVTLSAGVALTMLQSRSYTATAVPDPSTSSTATKNVLVVGDTGAPRPVALALLNYSLWSPRRALADLGISVSAGPVLQTGGKSDLATLGFFAGLSVSLLHNFYVTPGVHVGQYAGPPAGLKAGDTIPSGIATPTPVKSWENSFAIGITFRTTSLSSSKVTGTDTTK